MSAYLQYDNFPLKYQKSHFYLLGKVRNAIRIIYHVLTEFRNSL